MNTLQCNQSEDEAGDEDRMMMLYDVMMMMSRCLFTEK